jgi:hypothetical protein
MPYDEELAARIREIIAGEPALTERKILGGIAFLIGGNMAVAASGHGGLMVRVDPAQSGTLIGTTPAPMVEMRRRAMSGWLCLEAADLDALGETHGMGQARGLIRTDAARQTLTPDLGRACPERRSLPTEHAMPECPPLNMSSAKPRAPWAHAAPLPANRDIVTGADFSASRRQDPSHGSIAHRARCADGSEPGDGHHQFGEPQVVQNGDHAE